jgi:hypothetical protein
MPTHDRDRRAEAAVSNVARPGPAFLLELTLTQLELLPQHFARLMAPGILKPHDRARLRDARTAFYESTKRTAE